MKKLIFLIISFLGIIPFSFSQGHWGLGGNNGFPPPDGVNATNNILGTNVNIPINVITNSRNRMLINNGGTTNTDGRVAMGNNLAIGFIPRSRLHLHHDDVSNISLRFTNSSTGTGNGDGFIVGYHAISATTNRQYAELNNRENTAMKFFC